LLFGLSISAENFGRASSFLLTREGVEGGDMNGKVMIKYDQYRLLTNKKE
jgi:hypothetical protein